jgi:aspartyl-tRNA(Asn)/glutamyl-tRNA(Gln) amidotransferase subunit A
MVVPLRRLRLLSTTPPSPSSLTVSSALDRAERLGALLARAPSLPSPSQLERGLVFTAKANLCTGVLPTTAGSLALAGHVSPIQATCITRLLSQGAALLGTTAMDEFGMGSVTPGCSHPADPLRSPGGSSGGAAVAVAVGAGDFALGSDTGGSVRQPAAYCGVVGFKPSYGRISRFGLVPYANSLDCVGVMARDVGKVSQVLEICAGRDPLDPTSLEAEVEEQRGEGRVVRVGVPLEYDVAGLEAPVRERWVAAVQALEDLPGEFEVVTVSLPNTCHAVPAYYTIAMSEAASNLSKYEGARYGPRAAAVEGESLAAAYERTRGQMLGEEVRKRILTGTFIASAGRFDEYINQAMKIRRLVWRDFDAVFSSASAADRGVDVLLTPSCSGLAIEKSKIGDPVDLYSMDALTVPASLAGLPAISLPAGQDSSTGLPIGLQLIGKQARDNSLLRTAAKIEKVFKGKFF